jgi:TRAP-type mannitol/chloroaromatic compound transport system permease small subunit
MKQTINRISSRVGDWFAALFTFAALLLVPHAIIRPVIGYGLHYWTPIQWLALHAVLIILALCMALAAYVIADRTAVEPPEAY